MRNNKGRLDYASERRTVDDELMLLLGGKVCLLIYLLLSITFTITWRSVAPQLLVRFIAHGQCLREAYTTCHNWSHPEVHLAYQWFMVRPSLTLTLAMRKVAHESHWKVVKATWEFTAPEGWTRTL